MRTTQLLSKLEDVVCEAKLLIQDRHEIAHDLDKVCRERDEAREALKEHKAGSQNQHDMDSFTNRQIQNEREDLRKELKVAQDEIKKYRAREEGFSPFTISVVRERDEARVDLANTKTALKLAQNAYDATEYDLKKCREERRANEIALGSWMEVGRERAIVIHKLQGDVDTVRRELETAKHDLVVEKERQPHRVFLDERTRLQEQLLASETLLAETQAKLAVSEMDNIHVRKAREEYQKTVGVREDQLYKAQRRVQYLTDALQRVCQDLDPTASEVISRFALKGSIMKALYEAAKL